MTPLRRNTCLVAFISHWRPLCWRAAFRCRHRKRLSARAIRTRWSGEVLHRGPEGEARTHTGEDEDEGRVGGGRGRSRGSRVCPRAEEHQGFLTELHHDLVRYVAFQGWQSGRTLGSGDAHGSMISDVWEVRMFWSRSAASVLIVSSIDASHHTVSPCWRNHSP